MATGHIIAAARGELSPALFRVFCERRMGCYAAYRAAVAKATADYHDRLEIAWQAMGRPATSPAFQAKANLIWDYLRQDYAAASLNLDFALEAALIETRNGS